MESERYIQYSYLGETSFWVDGDNSCTKGIQELLKADIGKTAITACCKDGTWCDLVAGKDN